MKEEFRIILKEIASKEEFKSMLSENIQTKDLNKFINFLIERNLLFVVDFKGEKAERDILNFISQRLQMFKIKFEYDDSHLYKIDTSNLEVGDFVIKQIRDYQKQVSKYKMVIAELFVYTDFYLIAVIPKSTLTKLKKINLEKYYFKKFGENSNKEVLYTIQCENEIYSYEAFTTCGELNIWMKDIAEEPPKEGCCNRCGKSLFNDDGTPIFPMIIEPV